MFSSIINYFLGYMNVEVEGYYIEKFINECIANGIFLWGIKKQNACLLIAKIERNDIDNARRIGKKNQCFISIKNEKGIPVIMKKYKKRKVLLISLFVLILMIVGLSKFIWNIEVTGNEKIGTDEIMEEVKNNGIRIGMMKDRINIDGFINNIRMNREDMAWIGAEIKGTNLLIKVVEANEKPDIVNENDYCNIIADKSGEVIKIYAQRGTSIVKEGDIVKKGDVLIEGWMEGEFTEKQYTNAEGVIKVKTKYSKSEKIEKKEIIREKTGKKEKKYAIKFNNFKINFYKRLSKLKKYDTIYSEKKFKLFLNFYLPIKLLKYENFEVNETEKCNDYDTAKSYGENELRSEMDTLINGEIINRTTDVTEYENYYEVVNTYDVIEEIGTKEKIIF